MKNFNLRFSTMLIMAACFVLIEMAMVFHGAISDVISKWGNAFEMTAYLEDGVTDSERQQLEGTFSEFKPDFEFEYVSSEVSLKNLKKDLAGLVKSESDIDDLIGAAPAYLSIRANSGLSFDHVIEVFSNIKSRLKDNPTIAEVTYGEEWMKKYSHFVSGLSLLGLSIFAVLCGTLLFVISNTIRSSVYSRRDQIEIMELVGATKWMIRKPFLIEGVGTSLGAYTISIGISTLMVSLINSVYGGSGAYWGIFNQVNFFSIKEAILMMVVSIAIGLLGSFFTVRSLNNGWAAVQRVAK